MERAERVSSNIVFMVVAVDVDAVFVSRFDHTNIYLTKKILNAKHNNDSCWGNVSWCTAGRIRENEKWIKVNIGNNGFYVATSLMVLFLSIVFCYFTFACWLILVKCRIVCNKIIPNTSRQMDEFPVVWWAIRHRLGFGIERASTIWLHHQQSKWSGWCSIWGEFALLLSHSLLFKPVHCSNWTHIWKKWFFMRPTYSEIQRFMRWIERLNTITARSFSCMWFRDAQVKSICLRGNSETTKCLISMAMFDNFNYILG